MSEATTTESLPPTESEGGIPGWVKVAVILSLLTGAVAFLLTGSQQNDPFVYSKLVSEVVPNPGEFKDRTLRVEGDLRNGSVQFREEPCEWRFVLEKDGHEMPVTYPQCVVPDTFRDGMGISVVVEGTINQDKSFAATKVVPRCPSKYEMKEKLAAGEEMPHADVEGEESKDPAAKGMGEKKKTGSPFDIAEDLPPMN